MNNTFVGFLKSFINLTIVIASIIGSVILYTKLFSYMIIHPILFTVLYVAVILFVINIIDEITKDILSRTYYDKKELKELTNYVIDKCKEEQEKDEVYDNVVPMGD